MTRDHTILVANAHISTAMVIASRLILKREDDTEIYLTSSVATHQKLWQTLLLMKNHEVPKLKDDAISAWGLDLESPNAESEKGFDQGPAIADIKLKMQSRYLVGVAYASNIRAFDAEKNKPTIERTVAPILRALQERFWEQQIPVALILHPNLAGLPLRFEGCERMNIGKFHIAPGALSKEQKAVSDRVYDFLKP